VNPRRALRRPWCGALLLSLACLVLAAPASRAAPVTVPVQLDFPFLRDTLVRQLYTEPGTSARVLDDGHDCAVLTLADPQLDARDGRLRVRTLATARLGSFVLEHCTLPIDWSGELEVLLEPQVAEGSSSVRFSVVDSNVRKPDGSRAQIAGPLWNWMKESVHPRLASFHVELEQPIADLRAFLPLVLPDEDPARARRVADSVALAGARVVPQGLVADVRFDAPEDRPTPAPPVADAPPLSPEEIDALRERLDRWDAFLTFVLKHAGRDTPGEESRHELLTVLLDAREELVDALEEPPPGPDPVRTLFLSTWARLAPVLRRLESTTPGGDSLRYLSFVTAVDALATLDRLGPSTGVDVSAAGLRRLARMLAPSSTEDPLATSDAIDPEMRALFDFGEPIEPPPHEDDGAAREVISWTLVQRTPTAEELAKLRRWVPASDELDAYLALVHAVLDDAAEKAANKLQLEARHQPIYDWLVLAAAWKESCWRQFVLQAGKPVVIRSTAGAVGVLQVNVRVWRGFYDRASLEKDLPYNARAGAEILAHYLLDYAIPANEDTVGGSLDALARATYSAYNGGPRALRRWRHANAPASLRKIDDAFWRDYQAVKENGEPDRSTCYGA
jgi:hypothetical protein